MSRTTNFIFTIGMLNLVLDVPNGKAWNLLGIQRHAEDVDVLECSKTIVRGDHIIQCFESSPEIWIGSIGLPTYSFLYQAIYDEKELLSAQEDPSQPDPFDEVTLIATAYR